MSTYAASASVPPAPAPAGTGSSSLSFKTKTCLGVGECVNNIGINLPKGFAFPIYNLVLGVNPTLLGIAMMVPRLWDSITDPVMGTLSDNARTRWGRRRPFMVVGGLLTALMVLAICFVPRGMHERLGPGTWMGYSYGDWFYAAYLLVICIAFYTCMTIFAVPYGALALELSPDYRDRTRLMSFRTFFSNLSGIFMGWMFALAEWDFFKHPQTGEPDTITGARYVGVLLLVLLLVVSLIPALTVAEPFSSQQRSQAKVSIWFGLKQTLTNVPFLLITATYVVAFVGLITVMGVGFYVAIYHVYGGDRDAAAFTQSCASTVAVVVGMLSAISINLLSHRVEKKAILLGALAIAFTGGLLTWPLYTPDYPYLLIIPFAMIYPGITGLLIVTASMIADVCDLDELKTGLRREGMFWSVKCWIQKMAVSLALLFSGVILDLVGFQASEKTQLPEVIERMRLVFGGVVCLAMLSAGAIVLFVPLSRARMERVRVELEARRGPR